MQFVVIEMKINKKGNINAIEIILILNNKYKY